MLAYLSRFPPQPASPPRTGGLHDDMLPTAKQQQQQLQQGGGGRHQESSPEDSDFVMVPTSLAMDSAEASRRTSNNSRQQQGPHQGHGVRGQPMLASPSSRRHTVSGPHPAPPLARPANLPGMMHHQHPTQHQEPRPVPTQKAAYQQIEQSLIR